MELRLHKDHGVRVPSTRLKRLFRMIVEREADGSLSSLVNLVFTSDRRIRRLNKEFRGLDRATDVLSFSLDDPDDADDVFGEVYVSTDTAQRQAGEYGIGLYEEYLRLACHGFLHLMGYDHEKPRDEKLMREREEHYLKALGEVL